MTPPNRTLEVEVLSEASNSAVLKLPYRRFPGSLIQGDSLRILVDLARTVRDATRGGADTELADAAAELHASLQGRLLHYQDVLLTSGWSLPYDPPVAPPPPDVTEDDEAS